MTHKTPAPGSGFDHERAMPHAPPGTISGRVYGLMSGWKCVVVISALEDHGSDGLFWHISVSQSVVGERRPAGTYPEDVKHALEAFGMQGAEEDNTHSDGLTHHFWLRKQS